MPLPDELSELVDDVSEREEVEYKSWLDFTDGKARADLARHIAGLANFGGGHIVLGIDDKGSSCGSAPAGYAVDHDLIGSITQKYLDPALHCEVRWVQAKDGVDHPIIIVPPHGATPICAKMNGPEIKGRVSGITAGVYYLRKPGPETAPIISPAEWRDVIRRCALHDRTAILSAVSAALSPSSLARPADNAKLRDWAAAADAAYDMKIGDQEFVVPIRDARFQLSYRIETESPASVPLDRLENVLREITGEVDQTVRSGWSLFYIFNRDPLAPYWSNDASLPEDEFLEANLIATDRTSGFDFWRVSPDGLATVIREYREDTANFDAPSRRTFNPRRMMRVLAELVRHAEAFSSRFDHPVRVEFLCHWRGLAGRQLFVPDGIPFLTRAARVDAVTTSGTWAAADLGQRVPEIVATLGGKVARVLDWTGLSAERVAQEEPRWRDY